MKKFLLMFAAVAAIAFVGCKTETKPTEAEVVEEQTEEVAPTVESVTADLLNCADEASAVTLLDGLKQKAQAFLDGGDQAGYFNIINIIKTVWEANKDAILAKIPTLAEKMTNYIDVPENLKAGFAEFVANAAKEKVGEAVDAAADAAGAAVDAAKDKAGEAVDAAKDKAGEAVDAAKDKAADAAQKVADELKK
jgi:hypothetical protein